MITAIKTKYKNHTFRSRLEARWSIYFDSIGITWEYEPEGYELPNGKRYLPDFHVFGNGYDLYIEVKPKVTFSQNSDTGVINDIADRLSAFCSGINKPILLLIGEPSEEPGLVIYHDKINNKIGYNAVSIFNEYPIDIRKKAIRKSLSELFH
jgi:hypothetical protein